MAYNPDELFQQAKQVAESKKLIFIEEIVSFLPCDKTTFYKYFPLDSNELDELKTIINNNKVAIKSTMRKKWYDSDNPTLQLALYRLASTTEEHKKLNQKYQDITTDGDKLQNEPIQVQIIRSNATTEEES
jgi:hypothetical protein